MLGFISIKTKSTSITWLPTSCRIWDLPNSKATSQALHSLLFQWKFSFLTQVLSLHLICALQSDSRISLLPSIPHLLVVIASCIFPLQHFSQLYLFNYAIMAEYLLSLSQSTDMHISGNQSLYTSTGLYASPSDQTIAPQRHSVCTG